MLRALSEFDAERVEHAAMARREHRLITDAEQWRRQADQLQDRLSKVVEDMQVWRAAYLRCEELHARELVRREELETELAELRNPARGAV